MTSTATTSGHPTDTHDMIVIHRVFRRESALLGDLIRAVDPDDTARAEVVGAYLQDYAFGLHVHHSGEDELIWPLLQARAPLAADTVARMQVQHRIVVETLTSALALLPAWQAAPGPTTAAPLADALAEHRVEGRLTQKSGLMRFRRWYRRSYASHSPWGGTDNVPLVCGVESEIERSLSSSIMGSSPRVRHARSGGIIVRQGQRGEDLFLVLDGLVDVEVDGRTVARIGPGAVVGERASLADGRRTATLRAVTGCSVAS